MLSVFVIKTHPFVSKARFPNKKAAFPVFFGKSSSEHTPKRTFAPEAKNADEKYADIQVPGHPICFFGQGKYSLFGLKRQQLFSIVVKKRSSYHILPSFHIDLTGNERFSIKMSIAKEKGAVKRIKWKKLLTGENICAILEIEKKIYSITV